MAKSTVRKTQINTGPVGAHHPKKPKRLLRDELSKEVVRDGARYLEWSDDAFPPDTPKEIFKRSESSRIRKFLRDHTSDTLPWPPHGLNTKIESDNGRLRLWLEIEEDTSGKEIKDQVGNLITWKALLVAFDGKRDPLPPAIQTILGQLDDGQKTGEICQQINAWIARKLYQWEQVNGWQRREIDHDVACVLSLFGFSNEGSDEIMNKATADIRRGKYPFDKTIIETKGDEGKIINRNRHPVTREKLTSLLRTWKKKK